jgi:hypothetical protein
VKILLLQENPHITVPITRLTYNHSSHFNILFISTARHALEYITVRIRIAIHAIHAIYVRSTRSTRSMRSTCDPRRSADARSIEPATLSGELCAELCEKL